MFIKLTIRATGLVTLINTAKIVRLEKRENNTLIITDSRERERIEVRESMEQIVGTMSALGEIFDVSSYMPEGE